MTDTFSIPGIPQRDDSTQSNDQPAADTQLTPPAPQDAETITDEVGGTGDAKPEQTDDHQAQDPADPENLPHTTGQGTL